MRCAHLLLWSHINPMVARWAGSVGLRYVQYHAEAMVGEGAEDARASLERRLRIAAEPGTGAAASEEAHMDGRRLSYGQWVEMLGYEEGCLLARHCGPVLPAMRELNFPSAQMLDCGR